MTEAAPSVLEAVLRRDRAVVVAALVMVIGLSWLWIALGAGMEMSAVEMTRMPRWTSFWRTATRPRCVRPAGC